MKILQTIHCLDKSWGGPSTCTYQLVKGLNEIGTSTDIFSLASHSEGDRIGDDSFIKYVADDTKTPLRISSNYREFLSKNGRCYDIIHANTIWLWTTHSAVSFANSQRKPLVLSPHGMLYSEALKVSKWKKKIILPLFQLKDLKNADVLHATSIAELNAIRKFGLTNPVAVVPNGLYIGILPKMRTKENQIRHFGFVGRINPIKNIDILLQAWNLLGTKTSDCKLSIIGIEDINYEQQLRSYVTIHKLTNVKFVGFLSGDRLSEAINNLDYLVLPSKSENFGMVVPEALINGVPVIASRGTPWEELKQRKCGWWLDCSTDELSQTLLEAINLEESKRKEMGARGQKLVCEKYTIRSVALQMTSLYQWLLHDTDKPVFVYD